MAQDYRDDFKTIFAKWSDSIPSLMKSCKVYGLAIAVVDSDGVLYSQCFGYTDSSSEREIDEETVFSVQSVSKNFTALAMLIAERQDLLGLDNTVNDYLPSFKVNSRYESNPAEKISLRMLLQHRAGFTHEAPVGNNFYTEGSFEEHINSISDTWLRFPVDERYSYSNLGIDLAGYIIQEAAGCSFDQYLQENIFKPLNMKHSSFNQDIIKATSNRAVGYSRPDREAAFNLAIIPSGGLYTSISDFALYARMHLNRGKNSGKTFLEEEYLDDMYSFRQDSPGQLNGYGLGLSIKNEFGMSWYCHGGGGFGFCSNMLLFPEQDIAVVMLTNASYINFQSSLPMKIAFELIGAKTGSAPGPRFGEINYDSQEFEVDSLLQKQMAGTYLFDRGGNMLLDYENGRLGIWFSDGTFHPAIFTSANEFNFGPASNPSFHTIIPGDDKRAGRIMLHFNGQYLDHNDSPYMPHGPDKEAWKAYTGEYVYDYQKHQSPNEVPVKIKNGWLYIYDYRLVEHLPGLFFTAHGECLDMRGETPLWRNIRLRRKTGEP
jgi:CubicO group peptidase (beta-lactamase class C family)